MSEENGSKEDVESRFLTLGQKLTQAREILGLSIGEVAERLKLSARQIEALEQDDYSNLPESVFVRGFLRSYSRFLNLDENSIIADLDAALPKIKEELKAEAVVKKTRPSKPTTKVTAKMVGIGLVILVLAVVLAVQLFGENKEALQHDVAVGELVAPDTVYPAEIVSETIQENVASQASTPLQDTLEVSGLKITLGYRSHLRVLDVNGHELINQMVPSKSEHQIKGNGPFTVRIGYAKGATVQYNDKVIDIVAATHNNTAEFIVPKQP